MNLGKLDIIVLLIVGLIVLFVGAPALSGSSLVWMEEDGPPAVADPTDTFDHIQSIDGATVAGQFINEDTFQTVYTRSIKYCNTYTLSEEVDLVEEDNGISDTGEATTINTNEPTAITCVVSSSALEGDNDKEVIVMLLSYNTENGKYTPVGSIEELREMEESYNN